MAGYRLCEKELVRVAHRPLVVFFPKVAGFGEYCKDNLGNLLIDISLFFVGRFYFIIKNNFFVKNKTRYLYL